MQSENTASSVHDMLYHIAAIAHKQSDQALQECLGIGMSQYRIVRLLQEHSDFTQCEVAAALGQTEASISRQIKVMVSKGLLRTAPKPGDRRERAIGITVKGNKVGHAAADVLTSYHTPALAGYSEKQIQQLSDMAQKLHAFYCHEDKPYACHSTVN